MNKCEPLTMEELDQIERDVCTHVRETKDVMTSEFDEVGLSFEEFSRFVVTIRGVTADRDECRRDIEALHVALRQVKTERDAANEIAVARFKFAEGLEYQLAEERAAANAAVSAEQQARAELAAANAALVALADVVQGEFETSRHPVPAVIREHAAAIDAARKATR